MWPKSFKVPINNIFANLESEYPVFWNWRINSKTTPPCLLQTWAAVHQYVHAMWDCFQTVLLDHQRSIVKTNKSKQCLLWMKFLSTLPFFSKSFIGLSHTVLPNGLLNGTVHKFFAVIWSSRMLSLFIDFIGSFTKSSTAWIEICIKQINDVFQIKSIETSQMTFDFDRQKPVHSSTPFLLIWTTEWLEQTRTCSWNKLWSKLTFDPWNCTKIFDQRWTLLCFNDEPKCVPTEAFH